MTLTYKSSPWCPTCGGSGVVPLPQRIVEPWIDDLAVRTQLCPTCKGTGVAAAPVGEESAVTAEQNIIACAVQLAKANESYLACYAEFEDDLSACSERNDERETAIEQLMTAVRQYADVRDPAVWDKWRKGQGFDGR